MDLQGSQDYAVIMIDLCQFGVVMFKELFQITWTLECITGTNNIVAKKKLPTVLAQITVTFCCGRSH